MKAVRQRVADPQTGEIKPDIRLIRVRLRTPEDDFRDDGPTLPEQVDPMRPTTGSSQVPDSDAIRSGNPVDSLKSDHEIKEESTPPDTEAKEYRQNDQITGSAI